MDRPSAGLLSCWVKPPPDQIARLLMDVDWLDASSQGTSVTDGFVICCS